MKSKLWMASYLIVLLLANGCQNQVKKSPIVHAHRGGAALYPENTIPAMKNAVALGVPVLEFDLHITKDSFVVVSHDAFLNSQKALMINGDTIPTLQEKEYKIYSMTYDSLSRYDVGSHPNPLYPKRKNMKCSIPLLTDLIDSIETYTKNKTITPISYNIEIKSDPQKDNIYSPDYKTFVNLCMNVLLKKNLGDRLLVQCFDVRSLNYLHEKYPMIRLSYLVEDKKASFEELMSRLNFTPQVYSPESDMLNKEIIDKAHAKGMEIAPWTVDDKEEVKRLKDLGVDAIITNQPDKVMNWLKDK